MNDQFPNDLFSAYFDGELTPEERERADEVLAESAAAQQELSEYGELSNLLKSLPTHSLPSEFRTKVMQAAERESLIPSGDVVAAQSKSQDGRTGWRYGLIAMAVSAAAIVVMVRVIADQGAVEVRGLQSPSVASAEKNKAAIGTGMGDAEADVAVAAQSDDSPVAMRGAVKDRVHADADAEPSVAIPSPPRREVAAAAADEAPGGIGSPSAGNAPSQSKPAALVFNQGRLNNARVGDVVEAFDTSGGTIAVVTLTVVDRRAGDGLKELQLLLARNKIPIQEADERGLAGLELAGAKQQNSTDRLTAVFVETDQAQLASALRDLQKQEVFRDLQIEQPIRIASLDALAQAQMGFLKRKAGTDKFGKPSPVTKADARPAGPAPAVDSPVNEVVTAEKKRAAAARRSIRQKGGLPKLVETTKEAEQAKKKLDQPAKPQLAAKQPAENTVANKPSDAKAVDGISRQRSLSVQRKLIAFSREPLERQGKNKATHRDLKQAAPSAATVLADSIRGVSDEAKASVLRKQDASATGPKAKTARPLKILFVLVQDGAGTPPAAGKATKQAPKAKAATEPREKGAA